jgi:hypothetical protein
MLEVDFPRNVDNVNSFAVFVKESISLMSGLSLSWSVGGRSAEDSSDMFNFESKSSTIWFGS